MNIKKMMSDGMGRGIVLVAAVALLPALGGCSTDAEQRAALLEQENLDLRARNDQLTGALSDTDNRRALLEGEARALRAENERLLMTPAAAAPSSMNLITGFEGLTGVTTSMRSGELVVDIAGDVLFDSGKTTLKSKAKKTLDTIASTLNGSYGGNVIRIAGHTDSDPIRKSKWKTNERLSSERALAVEEYLAKKGVDRDRMYSAAFGPSNPKGSKNSSRRVEIVILADAGN